MFAQLALAGGISAPYNCAGTEMRPSRARDSTYSRLGCPPPFLGRVRRSIDETCPSRLVAVRHGLLAVPCPLRWWIAG
jgi:hypothetical protein